MLFSHNYNFPPIYHRQQTRLQYISYPKHGSKIFWLICQKAIEDTRMRQFGMKPKTETMLIAAHFGGSLFSWQPTLEDHISPRVDKIFIANIEASPVECN